MPTLVVIGGPNGSGKTTLTSYLIDHGRIRSAVINPDEIAIKEFGNYSFHVKAARVALERRTGNREWRRFSFRNYILGELGDKPSFSGKVGWL